MAIAFIDGLALTLASELIVHAGSLLSNVLRGDAKQRVLKDAFSDAFKQALKISLMGATEAEKRDVAAELNTLIKDEAVKHLLLDFALLENQPDVGDFATLGVHGLRKRTFRTLRSFIEVLPTELQLRAEDNDSPIYNLISNRKMNQIRDIVSNLPSDLNDLKQLVQALLDKVQFQSETSKPEISRTQNTVQSGNIISHSGDVHITYSETPPAVYQYLLARIGILEDENNIYAKKLDSEREEKRELSQSNARLERELALLRSEQTNKLARLADQEYGQANFSGALRNIQLLINIIASPELLFSRGVVLHKQGNLDDALVDYNKAIELNPQYAQAYNNRGAIRSQLSDYDSALADYNKAIELNPQYAQAYSNRGVLHRDHGDYDDALADYTKAIELDPQYAQAYNNRGVLRRKQDNYDSALADFNKIIALKPSSAEAYTNRGGLRGELGDFEGALTDFKKAIELNPRFAVAYFNRGIVKYQQNDYAGALADYTTAIELDPQYAQAYNNRGVIVGDQGDNAAAIADYTTAIKLDPQYAQAYFNRGTILSNQGEYDAALADYSRAIELNDDLAEAYSNRGVVHGERGEYDAALADYNKAIILNSQYTQAYNNRGVLYQRQGNFADALADFNKAIELNPEEDTAYSNRGSVHTELGNFADALADLSKAIELNREAYLAFKHRGFLYFKQGMLQPSLKEFEIYCELVPNDPLGHINRAFLLYQFEETAAAEQAWKVSTTLPNAPHFGFAGHAVALQSLQRYSESKMRYEVAINMDRRWLTDLRGVAQEFYWTEEMIHLAESILKSIQA